jgi:hypothetical protein
MQVAKKRKAERIRGQRKSQVAKTYCYGVEEVAKIKPQVEMIQRIRLKRNAEVINKHDEFEDDVAKRRKLKAVSLHDNTQQPRCNGGAAGECSLTRALMPARMKITLVHESRSKEVAGDSNLGASNCNDATIKGITSNGRPVNLIQPTRSTKQGFCANHAQDSLSRLLRRM